MIYGIDFDGTFTGDPTSFGKIIQILWEAGHTCIIVTNRPDTVDHWMIVREWADLAGVGTIRALFTNGRPKREIAREAGFEVDVWMDDNPILVDYGYAGIEKLGFQH